MLRIHAIDLILSTVCPFCRSSLRQSSAIVHCISCRTGHHLDCWNENEGHCSVFSCNGIRGKMSVSWVWWALALHNLANVGIHFGIHSLGPVVDFLSIPHAFALLGLESFLITTGISAWIKCRINGEMKTDSGLSFLSIVTLASNTTFVLFLLAYLVSEGLHALLALIQF